MLGVICSSARLAEPFVLLSAALVLPGNRNHWTLLTRVHLDSDSFAYLGAAAPLGAFNLLVAGTFFMLREIELAGALASHVYLDSIKELATWLLPVSKTDAKALGTKRTWGCVCGGIMDYVCPYHSLARQFDLLHANFGINSTLPDWLPLFPDVQGGFVNKSTVVTIVETAALSLNEPLTNPLGHRRYGGHSLRTSGARLLSALGIELFKIQLLARWVSPVILRYVRDAPLASLTDDYIRLHDRQCDDSEYLPAASSVQKLQGRVEAIETWIADHKQEDLELQGAVSRLNAAGSPSKFVLNVSSGVIHRVLVDGLHVHPSTWRTCCGWRFHAANVQRFEHLCLQSHRTVCDKCLPEERVQTVDPLSDDMEQE